MAGQDAPPRLHTRDEPGGEFTGAVVAPAVVDEAWREEVDFTDRFGQ